MKKTSKTMEQALDRVVFGTNNPKAIDKKLDQMEQYLQLEASSLGHSLAGIRHRNYWSLEKTAEMADVSVSVWRGWEADLDIPSPEQLKTVLERLHWSWELGRLLKLRENGSRLRLRRLASLQPMMLAAHGVLGVSGSYEWTSLGEELQGKMRRWAASRDLEFPTALIDVLASLGSEEEREAWIDEILNGG